MTTPLERYQQDLEQPGFMADPCQAQAVKALQALYDSWCEREKTWGFHFKQKLIQYQLMKVTPLQGLYLWGGVGRGKTYLVDLFFECLPTQRKLRLHFHRFMHRVHHDLNQYQNVADPLNLVAQHFKKDADIICFDEMFVSDITDAMLLGRLLEKLFALGITLVATSNIPPDDLYKEGLQRQQFLPAIALIKQHMKELNVDNQVDYRLRTLTKVKIYHYPIEEHFEKELENVFVELAPEKGQRQQPIDVNGRLIETKALSDGVIWCDFYSLCDGPRSQSDYIEIAQCYHSVIVSSVPQFKAEDDDKARRFIALVDELYDRQVKLILTAAVPLDELYQGPRLTFEFKRTHSRLTEMQTKEYLSLPHKL